MHRDAGVLVLRGAVDGERRFAHVGELPAALFAGQFLFADLFRLARRLAGPHVEDQRLFRRAACRCEAARAGEGQTEHGASHGS